MSQNHQLVRVGFKIIKFQIIMSRQHIPFGGHVMITCREKSGEFIPAIMDTPYQTPVIDALIRRSVIAKRKWPGRFHPDQQYSGSTAEL
jgi:hypothetical protein